MQLCFRKKSKQYCMMRSNSFETQVVRKIPADRKAIDFVFWMRIIEEDFHKKVKE